MEGLAAGWGDTTTHRHQCQFWIVSGKPETVANSQPKSAHSYLSISYPQVSWLGKVSHREPDCCCHKTAKWSLPASKVRAGFVRHGSAAQVKILVDVQWVKLSLPARETQSTNKLPTTNAPTNTIEKVCLHCGHSPAEESDPAVRSSSLICKFSSVQSKHRCIIQGLDLPFSLVFDLFR